MYNIVIVLVGGFLLDLILGDPHWLWHPVRGIGKLVTLTSRCLRRIFPVNKRGELIGGMFLVIVVIAITVVIPVALIVMLNRINHYVSLAFQVILCAQMLATKSLKDESMKVHDALIKDDVEGARTEVSMIVGRDTKNLSEHGIIKATIETVAENTSDGSIAPMFYMAIGGPILGVLYKAVNTMDSMVGYKNERYLYFGRVAAKLDDVLNYIPARLSAYLMILAAYVKRYHPAKAWKIYHRDKNHHSSPNSAHTEAVVAGALEIQLGGDAYYFGVLHHKQTIGDPIREVQKNDIKRANELLYLTALLGVILFNGIRLIIQYMINVI